MRFLADKAGHATVDLAGQRDKVRVEVVLARLPFEIMRIERYAVPAHARTWIKRHNAKRLGKRGVEHFPDVKAHAVAQNRQLIDERDVDGAEGVFEYLDQLGRLGAGNGNDLFNRLLV